MKAVKVNNLVKFYTIILLNSGPKHGYELIKELQQKLGRKISASNVYPFLQELQRNKFIDFKETYKRDKKIYHLTSEGKKFVNNILEKFSYIMDVSLQKKVKTCAHCNCEIYKGAHIEKIKGKELTFCCIYCAQSYKKS